MFQRPYAGVFFFCNHDSGLFFLSLDSQRVKLKSEKDGSWDFLSLSLAQLRPREDLAKEFFFLYKIYENLLPFLQGKIIKLKVSSKINRYKV